MTLKEKLILISKHKKFDITNDIIDDLVDILKYNPKLINIDELSPITVDEWFRLIHDDELTLSNIHIWLLLNKSVDVIGEFGYTGLNRAVEMNNNKTAKLLLDNGADFKLKNKYGVDSFFTACSIGNMEFVKIFHSLGADVNTTCNDGSTPLISASYNGLYDIVIYLLKNGANHKIKNNKGENALDSAVKNLKYNNDVEKVIKLFSYLEF